MTRAKRLICAAGLIAGLAAVNSAKADVFVWTGGNANWNTLANWQQNGVAPATRLPNSASDTVTISNGSTVTANTEFGTTGNYAPVSLSGNSILKPVSGGARYTPLTVNGGILDNGYANDSNQTFSGTIGLQSGGLTIRNTDFYVKDLVLGGQITGTGGITVDAHYNASARGAQITNTTNSFVGDVRIVTGKLSSAYAGNQSTPVTDRALNGNDVLIGPGTTYSGSGWLIGFTQTYSNIYGGAGASTFVTMYDSTHSYIQKGKLLSPGPRDGSGTGTMTVASGSAASTWTVQKSSGGSDATLLFNLNNGAADQFIVPNANVALGTSAADLVLSLGNGWTDGTYTLMNLQNAATHVTGTFANDVGGVVSGTWNGQNWTANITYTGGDGNDVVLSNIVVPEPVTLALLAIGGLAGVARRRRQSCR